MFRSRWLRSLCNVTRSRKDRRRLAKQSRRPVRLMLEALEDRQLLSTSTEPLNSLANVQQTAEVVDGQRNFRLFALDKSHTLWDLEGNNWVQDAYNVSSVSAFRGANGNVIVLLTGLDHNAYAQVIDENGSKTLNGQIFTGGILASCSGFASTQGDTIFTFLKTDGTAEFRMYSSTGQLLDQESLGGWPSVSAVEYQGTIQVYTSDGYRFYVKNRDSNGHWSDWNQVNGSGYALQAIKDQRGNIELLALDQNRNVETETWTGTKWSGWQSLGGPVDSFSVDQDSLGAVHVFATFGGWIWQKWENSPQVGGTTNNWSKWVPKTSPQSTSTPPGTYTLAPGQTMAFSVSLPVNYFPTYQIDALGNYGLDTQGVEKVLESWVMDPNNHQNGPTHTGYHLNDMIATPINGIYTIYVKSLWTQPVSFKFTTPSGYPTPLQVTPSMSQPPGYSSVASLMSLPADPISKSVSLIPDSPEEQPTPSMGNSTVTQAAGDYTALAAAVAADTAVNTNYVIQISKNLTFDSGGQVSISKLGIGSSLILEGQSGNNYTLTGNGNRLFTIAKGQNVTFDDLTLTGGMVTNSKGIAGGGAILDGGGNVTLSKVVIKGNTASASEIAGGGGIAVTSGGSLTIQGGSAIQSNRAIGGNGGAGEDGGFAVGGGVYASGSGTIQITDSTFSNNSVQGGNGGQGTVITSSGSSGGWGGWAAGGGLYVTGSGWTVKLTGDTFSGNTAIGGNGGDGIAGKDATAPNTSGGDGGEGGDGGSALGGAAYFTVGQSGGASLTILNDPTHPSTFINNSAQAGAGGNGGAGGLSTGTASNSNGGAGGFAGFAAGGALDVAALIEEKTSTVNIGNTAFYGNKATGGAGSTGGAAGTGSTASQAGGMTAGTGGGVVGTAGSAAGQAGVNQSGGLAFGGGVGFILSQSTATMVNCTVANNVARGGAGSAGQPQGPAAGGGVFASSSIVLDNNTITQNTVSGGATAGGGVYCSQFGGSDTLVNNVVQGNQSLGSSTTDLEVGINVATPLASTTNNFISTVNEGDVSTTSNMTGNTQVQLGSVVGVGSNGNPTGGPIYYPLLSGVVSVGAGNTSVLNTIAAVEGTTPANAVDAVGNPILSNNTLALGAVQPKTSSVPIPPPPSPSPPPAPTPPPPVPQVPPLLAMFDSLLGGVETVNANGTETITDTFFGIPLIVSTFDSQGHLVSVILFGINITFLFV